MAGSRSVTPQGLTGEQARPAAPSQAPPPCVLGQDELVLQGALSHKHCMCKTLLSPNITLLLQSMWAPAWRLQVDAHGKRAGRAPGVDISWEIAVFPG